MYSYKINIDTTNLREMHVKFSQCSRQNVPLPNENTMLNDSE